MKAGLASTDYNIATEMHCVNTILSSAKSGFNVTLSASCTIYVYIEESTIVGD